MAEDLGAGWAAEHYLLVMEQDRLRGGMGLLEFARTVEILRRHLSGAPARVADVGAGPGEYSLWLAEQDHHVIARDLVPLHVQQLQEAADARGVVVDAAVGDARELDLASSSVDAVLLAGPLYHLTTRAARLRCFHEALRIARPGGLVVAAAISRWAVLFDGVLRLRLGEGDPAFPSLLDQAIREGVLTPLTPGGFSAYCHRPNELRAEAEDAGLQVVSLEAVEGAGAYLPDLEDRWHDPAARAAILDVARRSAQAPEMLGVGPHLLIVARTPS